jgi:diguanylate cyclase (GGDEF)-like protein
MVRDSPKLPKILLVDDDLCVRATIREVLELDAAEVILAKNGNDGIDAYFRYQPDLVLVDAVMPLLDGFGFCEKLKKLDVNRLTPILMITSLDDDESVARAFAAGANDYITKPFNLSILRQRIRQMLQQSQQVKDNFRMAAELQQDNRNLKILASRDSLTKLHNRRGFEQYLQQEWERMLRLKSPLSLIMCDIDFFKNYNDTYGHPTGDQCLARVSSAMRNTVRRSGDFIARYGGEEFVIVLPNTDLLGAVFVAESVRSAIKLLKIPHQNSAVENCVTMSLGVAMVYPTPPMDTTYLLDAADRALYQAKAQGRDQVALTKSQ